jgi:hypothetical protein
MTYNIDWTKPIEAYHPDGRVVPQEVERMGEEPWTVGNIAGGVWNKDGTPWEAPEGEEDWRIRNRESDKPIQATGIDEMVEALRPFAEWADWFDSCEQHPAGCPDEAAADEAVEITVGQLRAARTALQKMEE